MVSWDFFDTLAGRATGADPWRVFDLVGGEPYRKLRQEAEQQSDKSWPGIFAALRRITGWSAGRVDELREAEWRAELAGVFPIRENVDRVGPRDRIVTDTYFDARQVRTLATAIGIPSTVEIVASWDGKYSGRYWKSPAARDIEHHVGDNARSDFSQPRSAGIYATRYTGSDHTKDEKTLSIAGQWEIAGAARAARLQNPHRQGSDAHRWWDAAAAANVPFLLAAAALVRDYVQASRPSRVYFVSRDSILLSQAYHTIYGEPVGIFHASRQTMRDPSPDFLAYVKSLAVGALFVDLHGTGRSVRGFCGAHGIDLAYVYVCGQRRLAAQCPSLVQLKGIGTGTAVEVANYHDEGRVIDVVGGVPVRADLEYDPSPVREQRAATLAGVRACCRPPQRVTETQVAAAAEAIRRTVPRELLRQHQVEHPLPALGVVRK